ncbi:MAG: SAM-dependent methyltransferase [Bacteroidetes bacterium MedPE-SWsnd-G2]|nr:MAG: SAM-dependent methyltransferase [Bacteroidetes bacterium MedPE-SWsnd-G2]
MNKRILSVEIQEFINVNINSNISNLVLKGSPFLDVPMQLLIEQIEAKKRCETKLSNWFNTPSIYYPNKLNIEQTSSEITASFKSELMQGKSIIDLTGGFGVDCFYFSKRFNSVIHSEINPELSEIVEHNYKALGVTNIECVSGDGIEVLKTTPQNFDWIYIDPSRRHESKGKVFFLKDCLPNVPEHINMLVEKSENIMIKTSPLLDISSGLEELSYVKDIYIVAVNNEVKELLWCIKKGFEGDVKLHTCNLSSKGNEFFSFYKNEEPSSHVQLGEPKTYLYEPNASILKSGGFKVISKAFPIDKLHLHSHLYSGDQLIDFPGRKFKILDVLPYSKSVLKKELPKKANVTTRNFPERVDVIRKKYKIKDGGSTYLFFTTLMDNSKVVLCCEKCN